MIHEVTIPFSFDTSPIEESIANVGEGEVRKTIDKVVREGIYDVMPKKVAYGYHRNNYKPSSDKEIDWRKYLDERMAGFLNDNAQAIIDEAALIIAMRVGRKKAWREVLAELQAERGTDR